MNWTGLQHEHRVWVDREYPDQPPEVPATGVVEEAGELLHCVLKLEQKRVWGEETRYPDLYANLADAVGDLSLYGCSMCNALGWDLESIATEGALWYPAECSQMQYAVQLVKAAADVATPPYRRSALACLFSMMRTYCAEAGLHFDSTVEQTWNTVKLRRRDSPARPRIVCICGSTRFKEQMQLANFEESMAGRMVLTVGWFSHADRMYTPTAEEEVALDELHKRKIDMADDVLVVAPEAYVCLKCGQICTEYAGSMSKCCRATADVVPYMCESTRSEVEYAKAHGKAVRYWRDHASVGT